MPTQFLSSLSVHGVAFVRALQGEPLLRERLVELGFTPGQRVEVISLAAFGGPIHVRVRGGSIAVRRDEAACVQVVLDAPSCASTPGVPVAVVAA
ncbi:MAG: ferrous iron transport protein A [Planctomycetes bacterium]|nr:ferrous iron transport protein A [Planctomycetota bacterium]